MNEMVEAIGVSTTARLNRPRPQESSLFIHNRPNRSCVATTKTISTQDRTTTFPTTSYKHDTEDSISNFNGYGFWYGNRFYSADETIGDTHIDSSNKLNTSASSTTVSTVICNRDILSSDHVSGDAGAAVTVSAHGMNAPSHATTTISTRDKRRQKNLIKNESPIITKRVQKKWKKEIGSVSSLSTLP